MVSGRELLLLEVLVLPYLDYCLQVNTYVWCSNYCWHWLPVTIRYICLVRASAHMPPVTYNVGHVITGSTFTQVLYDLLKVER